jgi:hypothetical protein
LHEEKQPGARTVRVVAARESSRYLAVIIRLQQQLIRAEMNAQYPSSRKELEGTKG